jgi:hypothetical protein
MTGQSTTLAYENVTLPISYIYFRFYGVALIRCEESYHKPPPP